MYKFPSKDQLMTMPLKFVRGLDIRTPEEEALVQEVVNARLNEIPVEQEIYRADVPDIRTPEEEAHWQKIIDERTERVKPKAALLPVMVLPDAGTPASPAKIVQAETELRSKIAGLKAKKQKLIKEKAKQNANQA